MKKTISILILLALLIGGGWASLHFEEPIRNFFSISECMYPVILVILGMIIFLILLAVLIDNDEDGGNGGGGSSSGGGDGESSVSLMTDGHLGINLGGISIDTQDGSVGINVGSGISVNGF